MKRKIIDILLYVLFALIGVIAFVFAIVELRPLFNGEFVLFNNPAAAFVGYLFRGLYYLLMLTLITGLIVFKIRKKKYCIVLFLTSISLNVGALLSLIFYNFFVSALIFVLNAILFAICATGFFSKEEADN